MITIFCTKVGTKYGPEYVNRLYAMVKRHLTLDFKFVCTTDNKKGINPEIEVHKPRRKCWGWWNLQEAYSNPDWAEGGPIWYTGLDTVITGNIDRAIIGRDKLTLINDFSYCAPNQDALTRSSANIFKDTWADGIAYVPPDGYPELWELFVKYIEPWDKFPMHVFNTHHMRALGIVPDIYQEVEPGLVCSFKWPHPELKKPKEPICCFHGEPRPRQVSHIDWIKRNWRE